MKQKFKRGSRVRIRDKMPDYMSHFDCDCEAIVVYTYAQAYGGDDIDSYSLLLLKEDGEPYNLVCWYEEYQLTLIDGDIVKGLAILEKYKYGEKYEK